MNLNQLFASFLWCSKSASWGSTFPTLSLQASPRARSRRRCPPGSWEWKANSWRKWETRVLLLFGHYLSGPVSARVSESVSWPASLAQTPRPDVRLQLSSSHPTTASIRRSSCFLPAWNHRPFAFLQPKHPLPPKIELALSAVAPQFFLFLLLMFPPSGSLVQACVGARRGLTAKRERMAEEKWKGATLSKQIWRRGRGGRAGCNSLFYSTVWFLFPDAVRAQQCSCRLTPWSSGTLGSHAVLCFMCLQPGKQKRKFSSFFKSLVIELDKELYGPDNHLVEVTF